MQEIENLSLEQMQAFLDARLKADQGLLRRFVMKMTGLCRAQVTRLPGHFGKTRAVHPSVYRRHRFPRRYTTVDVALLLEVDHAHGRLNGPATRPARVGIGERRRR